MRVKLRASDARNSLASVARITERGNIVQFGPEEEEDTHIFNCTTGEKAMVRRKRPFWTRASSGRGRLSESRLKRATVDTTSERGARQGDRAALRSTVVHEDSRCELVHGALGVSNRCCGEHAVLIVTEH